MNMYEMKTEEKYFYQERFDLKKEEVISLLSSTKKLIRK